MESSLYLKTIAAKKFSPNGKKMINKKLFNVAFRFIDFFCMINIVGKTQRNIILFTIHHSVGEAFHECGKSQSSLSVIYLFQFYIIQRNE